jgi:hypothetical protein
MNPKRSLFRFVIVDAKEKERNITANIDKDTTPYPQSDAFAGPLLPSVVGSLLKNNFMIIPTIENAMKLFTRYSLDITIYNLLIKNALLPKHFCQSTFAKSAAKSRIFDK